MKARKIFSIIAVGIAFVLLCAVLGRNFILRSVISRAAVKLDQKYHVRFSAGSISFDGLRTIHLQDVSLVPPAGDTLLKAGSVSINPSYMKLIFGKLSYHRLLIEDVMIKMISDSSGSNFSLKKGNDTAELNQPVANSTEPNYGSKLNILFSRVLEIITGETNVKNFRIEYRSPANYRKYIIPDFISDGNQYACKVYNLSKKDTISWDVSGLVMKSSNGFNFRMIRESKSTSMVSLTGNEKSFKWLVDTFYFEAFGSSYLNKEMTVAIRGRFSNLQLNHWRISPDDVSISKGEIDFLLKAGNDYFKSDSTSTLSFNKFISRVAFGFEKKGPVYSIKINTGRMPASSLFESLPTGMFNSLQGMKTKGEIKYFLEFTMNKAEPDSLVFDSELSKYNFSISRFGNDYLPRINEEFLYTAYDGDRPVRTFSVGPSNPDFTPYNQISDFVKSAVMTSEDGSFMLHGGFNEEAFRQSIATNVKQGRFARGGSTISMQLVKNVYLSRNKTISRKLEEALIVWLIEKNHLVSKERMFEVYLNIIEWGPGIYGIKEAARFYFSKDPSNLTLAESIFLASIIPHPKYFRYSFDQTGQLKPFLTGFYRIVSDRMVRKNWITPFDTIGLRPVVQLNGPALIYILPNDPVPVDTTSTDEDFIN